MFTSSTAPPHAQPSSSSYFAEPVPIQVLPPSPPHHLPTPDVPSAHSKGESSGHESDNSPAVDPRPLVDRTSPIFQKFKLGFGIDLTWVNETGFTQLLDTLTAQSWVPLFSSLYRCEMIPSLMDEFCQNFTAGSTDGEDFITSTVKNKDIKIDSAYLAKALAIPNCGYCCYFKREDGVDIPGVSKSKMMKFLGGKSDSSSINHNHFSAFNKLLFNLVWRAIVPRTQHRNEANLLDCSLIYCLAKHLPINFPKIMLKHLTYTLTHGYKVGYGALFTKIFKDFNVDVSEEPIILPRVENLLGHASMKLLKLRVVNGKAMVNGGRCEAEAAKEEESEEKEVKKADAKEKEKKRTKKEPAQKDKGKTKEKEEVKKSGVSKKRSIPPTPTRRRSVRRRVAPKQMESVPIHIIDADTASESSVAKDTPHVPEHTSKGQDQGESSVNIGSMLQTILQTVTALETQQVNFINTTNASIVELQSQLDGLKNMVVETRAAILEKVDSITVEEVPVDSCV